jgi:hypothetical protein
MLYSDGSVDLCFKQKCKIIFKKKQNNKEMGRTYGTHGRKENCIQYWWGNLRGRDHLEDLCVDGRIILKCILMNLGLGRAGLWVGRAGPCPGR